VEKANAWLYQSLFLLSPQSGFQAQSLDFPFRSPKMKKNASEIKVVILGAGVIGLTTGIVLNLHGYNVTIVSNHKFDKLHSSNLADRPAELSSIHAAASIIPHTVEHPSEREILAISQKFFHRLAFSAGFGVRVQRHYEVAEVLLPPPEYARTVKDFTLLPLDGSGWVDDHNIPRRKSAPGVYGWYFNAFFAEVPTYMDALKQLYTDSGSRLVYKEVKTRAELENLDADIIINCMGRWAVEMFPEDKVNTKIIRGHMVKVGIHEVPRDQRDQYFSYNYAPKEEIYSRKYKDKNGNEITSKADVYFYPRSDGWLLGGSRQEGFPSIGEAWRAEDEQISGELFQKEGWEVPIPKPVWSLNRELILDITGIDIAHPNYPSYSFIGYRFARLPIRIEQGNELNSKDKLLIHNYGHGGAGYALSWGAAYEVLRIIERQINVRVEIDRNLGMANSYSASLRRVLTDLVVEEYIERMRNEFTPYI
jgi:D-amino-acid oxidase